MPNVEGVQDADRYIEAPPRCNNQLTSILDEVKNLNGQLFGVLLAQQHGGEEDVHRRKGWLLMMYVKTLEIP